MQNRKTREEWIQMIVGFVLTIVCIVFSILCMYTTKAPIVEKYALLFSILSAVIWIGLCVFCFMCTLKKMDSFVKILLSVFICAAFLLIVFYILLKTGFFNIIKDEDSLRAYIEKTGGWMPIAYILLQYLQVVILPIPSVVSTLAGVALFGPFWAMLYSLCGILLGTFTAFFIGRKLGGKAVAWMIGEDTLKKWQKKLKGKDNIVLTLMFLLPVFPDDVLCFVAGLSSMTTKYFVVMVIISRILGISTTCYSIDLIPFNTWWGLLIWIILFAVLITAVILIYKHLDDIQNRIKRKTKKKN